jgi:DNA-binding response OmpR family regulator
MEDIKIILAEDNEILRKSLYFFLVQKGFQVDQFANGQEALNSIIANNYDLILADINIPGISGMEITQYVRTQMLSDIPVIIFTSSNVEQTEIDCFDIGADEFIPKPISPLVLITRINNLLKKRSFRKHYN